MHRPAPRRLLTATTWLAAPPALILTLGPSLLANDPVVVQNADGTWPEAPALYTHPGERVPAEYISPTIVEGWDEVFAREARSPKTAFNPKRRNGGQGEWSTAGMTRHGSAHSGEQYLVNKYGDARMGIGFGRRLDVQGAWMIGQSDASVYPASIEAVGYRNGVEVARAPVFSMFTETPTWYAMKLGDIDRLEIVVAPKGGTTGEYGMDDLTLSVDGAEVVIDFERLGYGTKLTGSGYANFDWEVGTGEFLADVVHAPLSQDQGAVYLDDDHKTYGGGGTAPNLLQSFEATKFADSGGWLPPDTCGAVGPNHFVEVVNSRISVFLKTTGARVLHTDLNAFLAGDSYGDPRVTYDKISQRFIVNAVDFNNEISFAISNTSDPTGTWTKAAFNPSTGGDAGKWPDYQTLGVNKDFIVTCAYMVGGSQLMSCFAIDKQNFINTGVLTVTAFRNLPWEGAIHGATTWDNTASQYLVSRAGSGLRIRRLNLPANAPTLSELGIASTSVGSSPPNAPQSGGPALDTLDGRPMNAVWINGFLWTTNCIASAGKAGCRWYQVNTSTITVAQTGTVDDTTLYYFAPSIAVNQAGNVAMGFTGSHSGIFAACYFTGRKASDPSGQMGVPVQYKVGESAYNDGNGPRWGDYSLTSIDPTDNTTFWTVTEYAESGGGANWGTYVAKLGYPGINDCNNNGIDDSIDISNGTSLDCDGNGVPDECQPDCDGDGIPDVCEVDCNANGTPDDCENFTDCNNNGIPDSCDPDCDHDGLPDDCEADCNNDGLPDDCQNLQDCNNDGIPDICQTFNDCNNNGIPDPCEPDCDADGIPDDCEQDCDQNGIPDDCDIIVFDCDNDGIPDGCEPDCDGDGLPDDCEIDCNLNGIPDDCENFTDCNGNGVPDECDISSGSSTDANSNGIPDECENLIVDYCYCTTGICGNADASAGCANSTGSGALLSSSGSTSVAADNLSLSMSPLANNQFGLFFMGNNTSNIAFGDGFRCVSGSLFRYPITNSGGTGTISFGPIVSWANTHFAGGGHINAGNTWHFQGWYRDPMGPCGNAFNLTQGKTIVFVP